MVLASIASLASRRPWSFGAALTACKTFTFDFIAQMYIERKDELDVRRSLVFTCFGFTYLGCWQYYLFCKVFPRVVPGAAAFAAKPLREKLRDVPGLRGLAKQLFLENGINNVFLYLPCFYTVQHALEEGPAAAASGAGLRKFAANAREDLPAVWSFWVPAQLVNFGFSPIWMRVPFTVGVSCCWTTYISLARGHFVRGGADAETTHPHR